MNNFFFAQNKSGGKSGAAFTGSIRLLNQMPYENLYNNSDVYPLTIYLIVRNSGEEKLKELGSMSKFNLKPGESSTCSIDLSMTEDNMDFDQITGLAILSHDKIYGNTGSKYEIQTILPMILDDEHRSLTINGVSHKLNQQSPLNMTQSKNLLIYLEDPVDVKKYLEIDLDVVIKTRGILHIYLPWDPKITKETGHYVIGHMSEPSDIRFEFAGDSDITLEKARDLMISGEVYKVDIQQNWFGGREYKSVDNGFNSCDYNLIGYNDDSVVLQLNTRKETSYQDETADVWKLENAWFIYAYHEEIQHQDWKLKITSLPVVRIEFKRNSPYIYLYGFLSSVDSVTLNNGVVLPELTYPNFGQEDFLTLVHYVSDDQDQDQINKEGFIFPFMAKYPKWDSSINEQDMFNWVKMTGYLEQRGSSETYAYNMPFRWGIYDGYIFVESIITSMYKSRIGDDIDPDDGRIIRFTSQPSDFKIPLTAYNNPKDSLKCWLECASDYYERNKVDFTGDGKDTSQEVYQGLLGYGFDSENYPSYTLDYKYEKEGYEYLPE